MDDPIPYPIDGILDLHAFAPRDARSVVTEYLRACREQDVLRVRIIHGKGRSVLRSMVHSLLDRDPAVDRFQLSSGDRSGWGATIVWLNPL